MTFLEPFLLWALPLAALPVVVHLLNLRRHKKVEWGAMQFLLQATRQRRGHTRLRHLLILAARVLAIAALIFVISRPMAGRWFGLFGGRPETVMVVLDRSNSMGQQDIQTGQSKRSMALERITDAIRRAGSPRNLVLIESSGANPKLLGSPDSLLEMSETRATDAAANLPAMLQDALDYIVANKSGRTDIWICSDLQATDWNAESSQWSAIRSGFEELKQPIRFHLLAYDQPAEQNLAARVLKLSRRKGNDADQLVLDIQVRRRQADQPVTVPLEVVVDGARSVVDLDIPGEVMELTDHVVPLDQQRESGWGKIELPNDENPRDSVFFFSYGDTVSKQTMVVSDDPGSAWAFRLAAAPPHQQGSSANVISVNDVMNVKWQEVSFIIWQAALPQGDTWQQLKRFVDAGGSVMFFPIPGDDDTEVLGHRWGRWEKLPEDGGQAVDKWRDDSGLLAHVDSGDPLPVNRLVVRDYRKIQGGGQVLARLRSGDPLLLRVPTDKGGVYFATTLPQEPYSNMARQGIVFFVAMQRALNVGWQRLADDQFGEIQPMDRLANGAPWQLVDGWPEGGLSTQQQLVAGVFQEGEVLRARNRPLTEDTTGHLTSDQVDQLMSGLNYRIVQDTIRGGRTLVAEIWRGFVVLLIVALIAESLLCLPDVRPKKLVAA